MKILVCGGRNFSDRALVIRVLDYLNRPSRPITHLIHGACRGADLLAADWATLRSIPTTAYPADWSLHGPAAGPIRNALMLDEGKPSLVIAFPGGRGTTSCLALARARSIPIHVVPC